MSRRALGANTLLSFRQINHFNGVCVCKQREGCFERLTTFQVKKKKKKGLIGLHAQDSYQDRLVLFNVLMYDVFHVPDVLIVLLYM